ncbi:33 kDa ribonucleoprotein, chloroplastic [Rhododendron vialii]|uniref:33 kDa ribonucleoprotein, chloroplastic n=1 Tax=Rhododendron vialii TaxID=182163 RepID=UPI00265E9F1D|nr:33 kDa ribonucleoprotein, chloroplastic [Rhododendron vialii]
MSVSMAATSSSSTSLPLRRNLLHFHSDFHSLSPTPKPIKALKLKTQFPHAPASSLLFRSLLIRASAYTQQQEGFGHPIEQEYEDQIQTERRLYVGNLPYSMTSAELGEIFGEAGVVKSVTIVYDRVTDRSRGFAFVKMGSVEEAKEAIRMYDGSQIGGRTVKVNFPEVPRGGEREVMEPRIRTSDQGFVDSPHKLYAGNLGWNITSQGLREAFEGYPGLLSAKVIYDRDSARSRGYGFVTFSSAEEVEYALNAMNGMELEGRPLRLNQAEERAPIPPRQARNSENSFGGSEMISSFSN